MRTDPRRYTAAALCGLLVLFTCASSLRAYVTSSSKWTGPIVLHLALGTPASPLTDGSTTWDSVAQAALAAWNPYMGSIQFSGVNASGAAKAQGNGINNVFFSSSVYGSAFGSNTLAITVSYASGNRRVEGDVLFNTAFAWDSYRGAIRFSGGNSIQDFYRVALHEFGHVLGLDHPDQAGQSVQAIMNSTISNLDTLTADDASGALALYVPGGLTAPSISSHPTAQTVTAGATAQFSVTAAGSAPLAYQWSRGGTPVSGATQSTLILSNVSTAVAGTYTVTVSNAAGSVTSNGALLTVLPAATPPQIITHPQSQTAMTGTSVTFTTSVSGTPPFSYQWKRDNQTVAIQSTPNLTLTSVSSANAGAYTVTVSNAAGSATSNAAILTVTPANVAPVIVSPPISRTVALGNPVSFQVVASGTPLPSYQWYHDGIAIPGATSSTFTIASVAQQDAGAYTVVATNSAGFVTSPTALLTISVPPTITTGPVSLTVTAGNPVSLTVSASGSAPLFYQWSKNGSSIPGATASTFTLGFANVSDSGTYTVRVTNSAGSVISSPAVLTVTPASFAPVIQSQPQSAKVAAGGSVTFSVGATGLPTPDYQWSRNGTALSGATSASLVLNNLSPANAGSYTVRVSNSLGSVVSSAAVLTVTTPPSIVTQPASQTVTAGDTVSLSVVATGTAPLSYQWKKDSNLIAGANASTLNFTPISLSDAGAYTVTVQNALGSVTSTVATLTVQPPYSPPKILTHPASQTVISGDTVTFRVVASGLPTPTYQWFNGAALIPGATDSSFSMSGVSIINSGSYRVVVSNSLGSLTSDSAYLTVLAPPHILSAPSSQSAVLGATISLEVSASGTAPLTYQWYRNDTPISGATQPSLTLTTLTNDDAGTYKVTVSNPAGSATSNPFTLSLSAAAAPPVITGGPLTQTAMEGSAVTFTVGASGTAPFTYAWSFNGQDIPGATQSTYQIPNVKLTDAGEYRVRLTNAAGSALSPIATLTVTPPPTAPHIIVQPQSQAVAPGSNVTLQIVADGTGPLRYQWYRDGTPIAGETSSVLQLLNFGAEVTGEYFVQITSAVGSVTSQNASLTLLPPSEVVNLSVRAQAGSGENALTVGFVIRGSSTKSLLLRGIGPTLTSYGVPNVLADPQLRLFREGAQPIGSNDNWGSTQGMATVFTNVGAFELPSASKDSAIVSALAEGSYTAQLTSTDAGTGVALVELYDTQPGSPGARLVNLSVRNFVGTQENTLLVGVIVKGTLPKRLLIRGVGPTLREFNVSGVLEDPKLAVISGADILSENDNWGGTAALKSVFESVGAFALPATSADSAMILSLQPGTYSIRLSGAGDSTGVAILEIYDLP